MHESQTKLRDCNSRLLAILDKLPDWCEVVLAVVCYGKPTLRLTQKSFLRLFPGREVEYGTCDLAIEETEARYIASNYGLLRDEPPRTYAIPATDPTGATP